MGKRSTAVLSRLAAAALLWALALQFAPLSPAARQAVQLVRGSSGNGASSPLLCSQLTAVPRVTQLPLWALLSFGFYAAASIGWSMLTFPACPEAAVELQRVRRRCARPAPSAARAAALLQSRGSHRLRCASCSACAVQSSCPARALGRCVRACWL